MKILIKLLVLFIAGTIPSFSQEFTETFEEPWLPGTGPDTGPPGGWGIYENGSGTTYNWTQTVLGNSTQPSYQGDYAAFVNKETVNAGLAEDWLVTPQFQMPDNAQLRFFSRLTTLGPQGNTYEVHISTGDAQDDWDSYTLLATYTEDEINPVYNQYTEVVIDIPPAYFGEQGYIALVMKNNNGDRWLVDSFSVVQKCLAPSGIVVPAASIGAETATVEWQANDQATSWEIELIPTSQAFSGIPNYTADTNSITIDDLSAATFYHLQVRAICSNGTTSDWSASVSFQTGFAPPVNDECLNAVVLSVSTGPECLTAAPGQIAMASASPGANPCAGSADDDVWFRFVATATTHIVTLSGQTGGDSDLHHGVYSGSCGTIGLLYCGTTPSSNVMGLVPGQEYFVRVYSESDQPQEIVFTICLTTPPPPPVNDNCEGALPVPVNTTEGCTLFTSGNIYSATPSPQPNTCQGSDDDDVWFAFTATATSHTIALLDIEGSSPNLFHTLYQGETCDDLVQLYCSNPESSVATDLVIGQTYKIRIYTYTGNPGQTTTFKVCVATPPAPPANDDCDNAVVLTVNTDLNCAAFGEGTLQSATAADIATNCDGSPDDDVWFSFTATGTTHAIALYDIAGSTTNLYHSLYASDDCTDFSEIYCSDVNNSTATNLIIGQTYKIRVYSFIELSGQNTIFKICVGTPPAPPSNDNCSEATEIVVNSGISCTSISGGALLAATPSSPPSECNGSADDDVWYRFTALASVQEIAISDVAGQTVDLYHAVYTGGCAELSLLVCSDQNISLLTGLTIGQEYFVRVYTATAVPGQDTTFSICVTTPPPPPANDECANMITAPVNPGLDCELVIQGTLVSATASPQVNNCLGTADDDVWYKFTASAVIHKVAITNLTGDGTLMTLGIYSGDCQNLMSLYCTSAESGYIPNLEIGTTYIVRVFSFTDSNLSTDFELCISTPEQPLKTSQDLTVTEIVEDVLISSTCAQVSNLSWKTGNTDGAGSENGIAYFSRGISNFPINEGIILSTGNALLAKGPNYSDLSSGTNTWLGDQQLLDYIIETDIDPYLVNYWNATVVEFDFTPLTDHFSFPFVFASEEYGVYQCDFSDAFAFFLTNTETGETTNLAVLPGTDIPISVVTIRDGSHFACDAVNEEYFEKMNVMENLASAIDYNGQTVLLTAASDVTPNTVYHIKLVIADRNDGVLDSAVFIGPFDIGEIDLGNDLLVDDLTALCEGDSYTIDSGLNPELYEIKWFFNGEEIAGETNPEITISQAGEYTIEAYYIPSSCSTTQSLTVEYYTPVNDTTGDPADLVHCDRNDLLFDFTENTNRILDGLNPNIYAVSYHSSENEAVLKEAALENPHAIQGDEQVIFVRIENLLTGCLGIKSFTIQLLDSQQHMELVAGCRDEGYSISVSAFNFNPDDSQYSWTLPDGSHSSEKNLVVAAEGVYTLTVISPEGCDLYGSIMIDMIPSCLLPRGISPNGDGLNDSFDLEGLEVMALSVFNRYGQQIYHFSGNYINQWHGQDDDGTSLPTGTYFYQIHRKNGADLTGWVYINAIP